MSLSPTHNIVKTRHAPTNHQYPANLLPAPSRLTLLLRIKRHTPATSAPRKLRTYLHSHNHHKQQSSVYEHPTTIAPYKSRQKTSSTYLCLRIKKVSRKRPATRPTFRLLRTSALALLALGQRLERHRTPAAAPYKRFACLHIHKKQESLLVAILKNQVLGTSKHPNLPVYRHHKNIL